MVIRMQQLVEIANILQKYLAYAKYYIYDTVYKTICRKTSIVTF